MLPVEQALYGAMPDDLVPDSHMYGADFPGAAALRAIYNVSLTALVVFGLEVLMRVVAESLSAALAWAPPRVPMDLR
ncbi:hypothetical protein T492DRAFT_886202 [Pavlovales sp. CCMP2436]|nr:hypothetical protein T492DRAFT_886202 [Pavlovales sp. CCMP2436]